MSEILLPGIKEILWQRQSADLRRMSDEFTDGKTLLCPTCLRRLNYEDFTVEHVYPQQALDKDPPEIKQLLTRNQRSRLILLCKRPLIISGKPIRGNGCNGWKGKHFDGRIREVFTGKFPLPNFNSRHHVAILILGYLALFRSYGYRVALSESGSIMRKQFFHPNDIIHEMPGFNGVILGGQPIEQFTNENISYWSEPFKITIQSNSAMIGIRNLAFPLPISEDLSIPFARALTYTPNRYRFRPDFRSFP